MSVRTIEHRSKKRHSHSPSRKTKSPSYFPRHLVDKFEGEHLSMNVHPANKQWRRSWRGYAAHIPSARIEAGIGQLYPLIKEVDYQKYMNHSQS